MFSLPQQIKSTLLHIIKFNKFEVFVSYYMLLMNAIKIIA